MDVNGTRLHLLLGRADWLGDAAASPDGALVWHEADHTLRLAEEQFVFPERPGNLRVSPGDRRGAARDRFGHWYWIGPGHDEILILVAGCGEPSRFWPPEHPGAPRRHLGGFGACAVPDPVAPRFAGLAVTDRHYLVVGDPGLPGVLVFDLHGGGPPRAVRWPVPLSPVDMAPAPDGGVWILDGPSGPGPSRYWLLDRHLRIRTLTPALPGPVPSPDFGPLSPPAPDPDAVPPPSAGSSAPVAAEWAVAVEALPDGSVMILDRGVAGGPTLRRYRGPDPVAPELGLPLDGRPVDVAFLAEPGAVGVGGVLFVAESQGDQAFAFRLAPDGATITPLVRYLPMRLFGGKGLVTAGGAVYYDTAGRWWELVDRRRSRHRREGELDLGPFDATEPGTVWHRLTIDACIPPDTEVTVRSRTADDKVALTRAGWRDEPGLYLRGLGSEIPYHRFGDPATVGAGTWELLFQRAVGRFLQLRLTVRGNGSRTPRLWALRAHSPRFSYLDAYLPDVYREDAESAHFLDRYLANVEGLFTGFEGRIEAAHRLLDVTTTEAAHLRWLAGWIGAALDAGWDEARSRLFIQHAVELFGRRGTRRGLVEAIRLATDPCPDSSIFGGARDPFGVRIVEDFLPAPLPVAPGDPATAGPRLVATAGRWRPADGREELDRRYRCFVARRYRDGAAVGAAWGRPVTAGQDATFAEPFPPLTPDGPAEAADRAAFLARAVGDPYAEVGPGDLEAYRCFLRERYRRTAALDDAWGLVGSSRLGSFDDVELPGAALPPDGPPLADWAVFVGRYLPAVRAAHRFTVLVPIRVEDPDAVREERMSAVAQVVEQERPAHAAFDVAPYWAAFRIGQARVGLDTVLGEGSRFVAIVLGRGRLAQGRLSGGHPWDVPDRWVLGRERVLPDGRRDTAG